MPQADKSIIITGASAGIGRACAHTFLKTGYSVGLVGRREEALIETAGDHANAIVLPCDVTDWQAVEDAFDRFVANTGRLDVLFNNAGMGSPGKTIDETSLEDWHNVVNVNLTGSFYCARKAFALMRAQSPQGGRIINNGSISAHAPRPGSVPYTSTKHAITGLTKTLSLDGRPYDIACGQIDIGNALTEMAFRMTQGVPQADGSTKVEAVMDVENVARSVLFMAETPDDANVQTLTVMATKMPFVGRG